MDKPAAAACYAKCKANSLGASLDCTALSTSVRTQKTRGEGVPKTSSLHWTVFRPFIIGFGCVSAI